MIQSLKPLVIAAFLAGAVLPGTSDAGVINGWNAVGNVFADASDQTLLLTERSLNANQLGRELGIDTSGLGINHGSAISRAFSGGGSLSFNWNFLTNEGSRPRNHNNDFAFWSLVNETTGETTGLGTLASAFDEDLATSDSDFFALETGPRSYPRSYVSDALPVGDYVFSIGVVNVGNNANHSHSALLVSNVSLPDPTVSNSVVNPEPASFAIWGLGVLGLTAGSFRRRQRQLAAKAS